MIGGATCAKVLVKTGGDRMDIEKALNKFRTEGDMGPALGGNGLRREDVTVGRAMKANLVVVFSNGSIDVDSDREAEEASATNRAGWRIGFECFGGGEI